MECMRFSGEVFLDVEVEIVSLLTLCLPELMCLCLFYVYIWAFDMFHSLIGVRAKIAPVLR